MQATNLIPTPSELAPVSTEVPPQTLEAALGAIATILREEYQEYRGEEILIDLYRVTGWSVWIDKIKEALLASGWNSLLQHEHSLGGKRQLILIPLEEE